MAMSADASVMDARPGTSGVHARDTGLRSEKGRTAAAATVLALTVSRPRSVAKTRSSVRTRTIEEPRDRGAVAHVVEREGTHGTRRSRLMNSVALFGSPRPFVSV